MWWAAVPAAISAIGLIAGQEDKKRAQAASDAAMAQLNALEIPDVEKQKLYLEKMKSAGVYSPEMEQALRQQDSEFGKVTTDPRLKAAQLKALASLQEIGDSKGLDLTSRAKYNEMQSQLAQQEQGQRGAIMQNMAARGMSGSGFDLAALLSNSQSQSQNASQQGMNMAAEAQQRALQAIMQSGELGGSIRGQDFYEQAAKAQAQDAINRFNTVNSQDVNSRNVQSRNNAQQSNLANDQSIANANVNIINQQQTQNKGLYQQDFENRYKKAGGVANAYNNQAAQYQNQAQDTRQTIGGIGQGVGQILASNAAEDRQDKRLKKYYGY